MSDKRLKMKPELCQFTLHFTASYQADEATNVVYQKREAVATGGIRTPSSYDDTVADDQAGKLIDAWHGSLDQQQSQYVSLVGVSWAWNETLDNGPLHEGVKVPGSITGGALTGEPLPYGLSKSLRLQTGLGGRGNHGRIYLAGLALSQINASAPDFLTDAAYAALGTRAAQFLADWNNNDIVAGVGHDYTMRVCSFVQNGGLRPYAHDPKVVAITLANNTLDYQRRRAG